MATHKFTIIEAQTPEEKQQAYQLRYKIFIEECGYQIPNVNAEIGLFDAEDEYANIFLAYDENNTPVGTVTLNWWKNGPLGEEEKYYKLHDFEKNFSRERIVIVRKLLVSDKYRGSSLVKQLTFTMITECLKPEVYFLFMDCSPYLVRYYEHFGLRRYAPHFYYDDSGILSVPMCFIPGDKAYLKNIRSPVIRLIEQMGYPDVPKAQKYFEQHWTIGRQIVEESNEEEELAKCTCPSELYEFELFNNVSPENIQAFLSRCEKVAFSAKDMLLSVSNPARDMLLIVKGYVEVTVPKEEHDLAIATQGPGQLLGEIHFLLGKGRSANIVALTDGEAFRISEAVIKTFFAEKPELLNQIYFNMLRELAERLRTTDLRVTQMPPL